MAITNVPITSLPEATSPSANDYLILQGTNTQKIKWSALVNKLYPVGCIYQSADATSPASFLGGTWERIKDRFLLAAGGTYAAGTEGGESTHTLTVSEMPNHSHVQTAFTSDGNFNPIISTASGADVSGAKQPIDYGYASSNAYLTTWGAGNDNAHNNMPPYVVKYIWQRIA